MVHLEGPNGSVDLDITQLLANAKVAERQMNKLASSENDDVEPERIAYADLTPSEKFWIRMHPVTPLAVLDDDFEVADIVLEGSDPPEAEIARLKAYVRELESAYVSEFKTTRETAEQCLADLREGFGVSDLFAEDDA